MSPQAFRRSPPVARGPVEPARPHGQFPRRRRRAARRTCSTARASGCSRFPTSATRRPSKSSMHFATLALPAPWKPTGEGGTATWGPFRAPRGICGKRPARAGSRPKCGQAVRHPVPLLFMVSHLLAPRYNGWFCGKNVDQHSSPSALPMSASEPARIESYLSRFGLSALPTRPGRGDPRPCWPAAIAYA